MHIQDFNITNPQHTYVHQAFRLLPYFPFFFILNISRMRMYFRNKFSNCLHGKTSSQGCWTCIIRTPACPTTLTSEREILPLLSLLT